MRCLNAVLDSLSHDAWTEWNHSVNPFSFLMLLKTITEPNLHLGAMWQKSAANRKLRRWEEYFFLVDPSYSSYPLYFSCWTPLKLLDCMSPSKKKSTVFPWIIPSCTSSCLIILRRKYFKWRKLDALKTQLHCNPEDKKQMCLGLIDRMGAAAVTGPPGHSFMQHRQEKYSLQQIHHGVISKTINEWILTWPANPTTSLVANMMCF